MYYLYRGEKTGRRGRPKVYNGKINLKQINTAYFTLEVDEPDKRIYSALVYAKGFKRTVKVAFVESLDSLTGHVKNKQCFISTDFALLGQLILSRALSARISIPRRQTIYGLNALSDAE